MFKIHSIPIIEDLKEYIINTKNEFIMDIAKNKLFKGTEPETSGGLLIVIKNKHSDLLLNNLRNEG